MAAPTVSSGSLVRLAVVVCVVVWGTTWSVIEVGLRAIPPMTGAALRFALAGTALLGYALVRRAPLGRDRREWWLWPVNGVLSFGASCAVVYWAQQWVPSGLAAVIFAAFPLFVVLLAHLLLPAERLSLASGAGALVGFGGMVIIFSEDLSRLGGPGTPRAALVMLLAPLASALGTVAVKKWGQGIGALSQTAVPMLVGAAMLGALAASSERDLPLAWTAAGVGSVLYLALAGSALTFLLYFWLLERVEATRVALIAYGAPVCAVLIGIVVMGERVTVRSLAGSAVVLLGVALASRPRR